MVVKNEKHKWMIGPEGVDPRNETVGLGTGDRCRGGFGACFINLPPRFVEHKGKVKVVLPIDAGKVRHARYEGIRHAHFEQSIAEVEEGFQRDFNGVDFTNR